MNAESAYIFCTGRVVAQRPSLQRKQALALREMARMLSDAHQNSNTSMSFFCVASLCFLGGFPGNREVKRPCAHVWISHTSSQPSAIMPDGCPRLIHFGQCLGRRRVDGNALRTIKNDGTLGLCCEPCPMSTHSTYSCKAQPVLLHLGLGCTIGIGGSQPNFLTTSVTLFNFVIKLGMTTGSWPTPITRMSFSVAQ